MTRITIERLEELIADVDGELVPGCSEWSQIHLKLRADKLAALHELRAYRKEGWQPIETAKDQSVLPWNGESVLICTNHNWGDRVHKAKWTDEIHGEGIFGWAVDDCKHGPYPLRGYTQVTHWMPLQAAQSHRRIAVTKRRTLRNLAWQASVRFLRKHPNAYPQVSFIEGYIRGAKRARRKP